MAKTYHEVTCLNCGDVYLSEWVGPRKLCRMCDEAAEIKFKMLAEIEDKKKAEGERHAKDLARLVDAERRMPWEKKRFRSMWDGHQE